MSPKGKHLILKHVAVATSPLPKNQGHTINIYNQNPFARPTPATKRKSVIIIEHALHKKEHIATWPTKVSKEECRFCGSNTVPPEYSCAMTRRTEVDFSLALSQMS
jgi:hypothetical protein